MMLDICVTLVHHKESGQRAMAGATNKSNQPMANVDMDTHKDVWEKLGLDKGTKETLDDFFCDDLPHEKVGVCNEANKRCKHESKIKYWKNKMLYKRTKVSKVWYLPNVPNL